MRAYLQEKETAMRLLGAQVVRTPIGLSSGSKLTHTGKHIVHALGVYTLKRPSYREAIEGNHSWWRYPGPI